MGIAFYREVLDGADHIKDISEKVAAELGSSTHNLVDFSTLVRPRVLLYRASDDRLIEFMLHSQKAQRGMRQSLTQGSGRLIVPVTLWGSNLTNDRHTRNSDRPTTISLGPKHSEDTGHILVRVTPQCLTRTAKDMNKVAGRTGIPLEGSTPSSQLGHGGFQRIPLLGFSEGSCAVDEAHLREMKEKISIEDLKLGPVEIAINETAEEEKAYGIIL